MSFALSAAARYVHCARIQGASIATAFKKFPQEPKGWPNRGNFLNFQGFLWCFLGFSADFLVFSMDCG